MNDEQKPEPPIFTGPSAQFDIDALLDRLREREREHDKEESQWQPGHSTN